MLHDKKEVDGEKLYAGRAMKKNERQSFLREKAILRRQQISQTSAKSNLYIKNLPENFSDEKLTEMFAPFGKILSAKVGVVTNPWVVFYFSVFLHSRLWSTTSVSPVDSDSSTCLLSRRFVDVVFSDSLKICQSF